MTAANIKTQTGTLMDILRHEIAQTGSISVVDYMNLCLSHPEHGYYMTRDPLGLRGDFTTAPEISQMFGEILGAYIAGQWQAIGAPVPFHLIECGPGRGTLMKDVLRVLQRVPELCDNLQIHLVEISPALRAIQKTTLKDFSVIWHENLKTVPQGACALFANEFLDALPIMQYQFQAGQWHERRIGFENGALAFVAGEAAQPNVTAAEGDVFEYAPVREDFVRQLCARLKRDKGFALLIDYGSSQSGFGDTLQAVSKHNYVSALENPGACDLTSHVDFGALKEVVRAEGLQSETMTQAEFLTAHGINERAQILRIKNPDATIDADLQRLVSKEQMGELFKVMTISS